MKYFSVSSCLLVCDYCKRLVCSIYGRQLIAMISGINLVEVDMASVSIVLKAQRKTIKVIFKQTIRHQIPLELAFLTPPPCPPSPPA